MTYPLDDPNLTVDEAVDAAWADLDPADRTDDTRALLVFRARAIRGEIELTGTAAEGATVTQ